MTDQEVLELLKKIDGGYKITDAEKEALAGIEALTWEEIEKIPNCLDILTGLRKLDVTGILLVDIPDSIGKLPSLKSLNLCEPEIRKLPDGIGNLKNLQSLTIFAPKIQKLPDSIGNLKNLQTLDLSIMQISSLPKSIKNLTSLESLDLKMTKIRELPDKIGNLRSLKILDLGLTQLQSLPDSIGRLGNLRELYLSDTLIRNLPNSIGNLGCLQHLDLRRTQLQALPDSIGSLRSLRKLYLSDTPIQTLPASTGDLRNLKILALEDLTLLGLPEELLSLNLEYRNEGCSYSDPRSGIYIHGLRLKKQPVSLFYQPRELIVDYYRQLSSENKETVPIDECKVVFLGDGGAGKSLIIDRLMHDGEISPEFDGDATPGICISSKKYRIGEDEIGLHFWDFGGQAIMHSMHRLFLTNRTLYVVVVNARDNKANEQAWYWIRNIKSFAEGAPVLLIVTHKDQNPSANINENGLRKEYPPLKNVRIISALKDTKEDFLAAVKNTLCHIVSKMETVHTPFSSAWLALMNDLQEMPEDYIDSQEFYNKCKRHDVETEKERLDQIISWYQDLGVCFYSRQHPISEKYMVLKPRWLLNALYILVFNGRDYARNGIIKEKDIYELVCRRVSDERIKKVYPDITYEVEHIQYILIVLLNYELIFRLDEEHFFIPMLCDENEPDSLGVFDSEDALQVNFEYSYLPENVLHKLMVRHGYDLNIDIVWKTGAVFTQKRCGWTALVRMKDNCLEVYTRASHSDTHPVNVYLDMIRESICKINEGFGITAEESIIFRKGGKKDCFDAEILKGNIENGQHFVYSKVFRTMVSIEEIFGVVNNQDRLFGQGSDSQINALLHALTDALLKLQDNRQYYSADENTCNTFIRFLLEQSGYICMDQSLHGVSGTGRSAGSPDILIEEKDTLKQLSFFEAQKLKGFGKAAREYLDDHLRRLLDNYNARGLRNLFLISYVDWEKEKFNELADNYSKYVVKKAPTGFKVVDSRLMDLFSDTFMRCVRIGYACGNTRMYVYHMIVRVAALTQQTNM